MKSQSTQKCKEGKEIQRMSTQVNTSQLKSTQVNSSQLKSTRVNTSQLNIIKGDQCIQILLCSMFLQYEKVVFNLVIYLQEIYKRHTRDVVNPNSSQDLSFWISHPSPPLPLYCFFCTHQQTRRRYPGITLLILLSLAMSYLDYELYIYFLYIFIVTVLLLSLLVYFSASFVYLMSGQCKTELVKNKRSCSLILTSFTL